MFRLKIALFSMVIAGSVLVLFSVFFLGVINKVGLDRIDREVLTLGESQLHVWHPRKHWQVFDQSLRSIYGQEHWQDLIVHVTDADHVLLYKSPHWPEQIAATAFPEFDDAMEPVSDGGFDKRAPGLPRAAVGNNPNGMPPRERRAGRIFQPSRLDDGLDRPPLPRRLVPPVKIKQPYYRTLETSAGIWRTGIMGNQHVTILLGRDMAGYYQETNRYRMIFFFSVPLALLLMVLGGWLVAHRALKPVSLITQTAERITAQGLGQRIPSTGADSEFLQLITVINDMLDRLEKSFNQAVRFSADTAHELQTPLTILQGILDDAVRNSENGSEEQQRSSDLLEEVQRLKVIVQKLLILSRADAGQLSLQIEPLDLSAMIRSIIEDVGVIAPQLQVEQDVLSQVIVEADPELLRQVIQNLTFNGVKYNLDDGLIRFCLTKQGKDVRFSVSNTGIPIPAKERQRIFDRFYRIDKSRSNRVPGSGLGLALALQIVRAHKGQLFLEDAAKDDLITFTLTLPQVSRHRHATE